MMQNPRLSSSGPVLSANVADLVLAKIGLTEQQNVNSGSAFVLSELLNLGGWELINDGGPAGNMSALVPPEAALGKLIQVNGFLRFSSLDNTNPLAVAHALMRYNKTTAQYTMLTIDAAERYAVAGTGATQTLVLDDLYDLRGVTKTLDFQIILQCNTNQSTSIAFPYGGNLVFQVKP